MTNTLSDCIDSLNSIIDECEVACFITRSRELQETARAQLQELILKARHLKAQAISYSDEDAANTFLGFECVGACLRSEINMWLLLKTGEADNAWDELVTAQDAAIDAVKAHPAFANLARRAEYLLRIEETIFPPQVFVSAGLIVQRQECSICASNYGDCDHLAGIPYMGEFCNVIAKDLKADHVAIVESPADKRCRITSFTDGDQERNRMTWELSRMSIQPPDIDQNKDIFDEQKPTVLFPKSRKVSATILRTRR